MHEEMVACVLQLLRERCEEAERLLESAKGYGAESYWDGQCNAFRNAIFVVERAVEIEKEYGA